MYHSTSSCYRCGSPEGNDARLCPACNEKKCSHTTKLIDASERRQRVTGTTVFLSTMIVICIGVLGAYAFWEKAPEQVYAQIEKGSRGAVYDSCMAQLNRISANTQASAITMVVERAFRDATCSSLQRECDLKPNGVKCGGGADFLAVDAKR